MVQILGTLQQYQQAAATQGKLVVIDFFATWCPPCKMIGPIFEQMSHQYPHVAFFKVDVDKNPQASQAGGIKAMPTFLFFKNGQQIHRIQGPNEAQIRQTIVSYGSVQQQHNTTHAHQAGVGAGHGSGMVPANTPCKSTAGTVPVKLFVDNKSGAPVKMDWINYNGQRQNYATIMPGTMVGQDTYVTNPWLFYTQQGHYMGIWLNNKNVAPGTEFHVDIDKNFKAHAYQGKKQQIQPAHKKPAVKPKVGGG